MPVDALALHWESIFRLTLPKLTDITDNWLFLFPLVVAVIDGWSVHVNLNFCFYFYFFFTFISLCTVCDSCSFVRISSLVEAKQHQYMYSVADKRIFWCDIDCILTLLWYFAVSLFPSFSRFVGINRERKKKHVLRGQCAFFFFSATSFERDRELWFFLPFE